MFPCCGVGRTCEAAWQICYQEISHWYPLSDCHASHLCGNSEQHKTGNLGMHYCMILPFKRLMLYLVDLHLVMGLFACSFDMLVVCTPRCCDADSASSHMLSREASPYCLWLPIGHPMQDIPPVAPAAAPREGVPGCLPVADALVPARW